MASKELKYTQAWDSIMHKWVSPAQVSRAERHDRNRYFSEKFDINEDKGKVLTLHKQSKIYKSKTGKDVIRKSHFCAIADNTREYRENTTKKIEKQESLVHKLCKEVISDTEFIRIPEVKANIMHSDIIIIPEQYIKINLKSIEKKDKVSGKIPDAIVETNILGKKQEIYIEFFYKHEVDENKRRQYSFYNINCIEIDLSELRDNLDESEKSLRKKIKDIISEKAYWINNRAKGIIEKEAFDEHVITMSIKNGLLNKSAYGASDYERLYIFKDTIPCDNKNHPCYFREEEKKSTNIGECKTCQNCIYLHNYSSSNILDIEVYCRKDGKNIRCNPSELISKIINSMIEKL